MLIVTYLEVNRIAAEMGLPTTANVEVCCKRAVPHALLASSRYDGSVYGDRKAHNMAIISECIVNKDKTLTVPKIAWKPKKITGAKFAAALGEDPFMTRFGLWCELTRVAQKPFVENKHTRAGNIIEDDIARYVQSKSRFSLVQPHMIWGYGYKSENNYDFYQERQKAGDEVWFFEFKTSTRKDIWERGVPISYERQAQLYAYLSGIPFYHFAVSFLTEGELDDPHSHVCTDANTMLFHKKLPEDFNNTISEAARWYDEFIADGATSPAYDEEKDREYLDILKERGYVL